MMVRIIIKESSLPFRFLNEACIFFVIIIKVNSIISRVLIIIVEYYFYKAFKTKIKLISFG